MNTASCAAPLIASEDDTLFVGAPFAEHSSLSKLQAVLVLSLAAWQYSA
jgi:hypothetical protein